MRNQPYKKELNSIGEITNPITLDKPFHNKTSDNRHVRNISDKYIVFNNPLTGEFVGRLKINGNNRANSCKRGKSSRQFHTA